MSIMTFGSNEEKPQVCEFVKVGLTLRDGDSQQLTLLAVPMIYVSLLPLSLLPSTRIMTISPDWILQTLQMGTYNWKSISWLDLITGRTRRGASGPVAIDTRLGWVLSGPTSFLTREQPSSGLVTHTL